MPGSLVRDSLSPQLFAGATLNAAGATNGTAVQVDKPGDVMVEIVTGTVTSTANSATLLVRLEGADDSAFTVNKTNICEFPVKSGSDASQSAAKYRQNTMCWKQWVRSVVTVGGTAPVYTGSTCKVHIERDRINVLTDTA